MMASKQNSNSRFEYLLKQTEVCTHFITNGTKQVVSKNNSHPNRKLKISKAGEQLEAEAEAEGPLLASEIKQFETTPHYIKNGQMRGYQLAGLNWLISLYENSIGGILADEMGLGKTLQTISLLGYLKHYKKQKHRHLIIVPITTVSNWLNECKRWCPTLKAVGLVGDRNQRHTIMCNELLAGKCDICITTYELCLIECGQLQKFDWCYVIIDEGHRIKNENTKLSTVVRSLQCSNRLLLSGTPFQNNIHELWALLNFLLPDVFNSADDFDEWFKIDPCITNESRVSRLHGVLKPFMLRRLKSDVEKSLLPKKEFKIYVSLTKMQLELYKKILLRDLHFVTSDGCKAVQLSNLLLLLRKCTNHPYMFDGYEPGPPYTTDLHLVENSGKLSVLDKLLPKLQGQGSRVLIFAQFLKMLDILEDYCDWRGYRYHRLSGYTARNQRTELIDEFNSSNSETFIFLLSTRAGGLGINLSTADVVIFYDSDWNPQVDLQAADRAHRIGQKKQVRIFRLITEGTIDEIIDDCAEKKLHLDKMVIQNHGRPDLSKENMLSVLRYNANQIFAVADAVSAEEDIDTMLSRGEIKTAEKLAKFTALSEQKPYATPIYQFDGKDYRESTGRLQSQQHLKDILAKAEDFQLYPKDLHRLANKTKMWTSEDIALKEELLKQSFGDWKRSHFEQFLNASMTYGGDDVEHLICAVSGIPPLEVLRYREAFWMRHTNIKNVEDIIHKILHFDKEAKAKRAIKELLDAKISRYTSPLIELVIEYNDKENNIPLNNNETFDEAMDRFLICTLHKIGYDTKDVFEKLFNAVKKTKMFNKKSFIKLCTSEQLSARCHELIELLQAEAQASSPKRIRLESTANSVQANTKYLRERKINVLNIV